MTEAAKQIQWIRNVYEEIGFHLGSLPLCVDNQGAMFLASNPAQEGRTKHVRIPEHYLREAENRKKFHSTMSPLISSSLISSRRTWARQSLRKADGVFDWCQYHH